MLAGGPAAFKTFIALDIALSVVTGSTSGVWSKINRTGPVLFAAGEGRSQITTRVKAWEKKYYGSEEAKDFVLIDPVPLIAQEEYWEEFIDLALREHPGGYQLVVLDTVGRAMQGLNENAQEYASKFTGLVDLIRGQLGATVLALHHTGHDVHARARGSSVFGADVDTMLMLKRDDETTHVELDMTKQKDAPEWGTPKIIKLETVHLSPTITSLVAVEPSEADAQKTNVARSGSTSKNDPRGDPMMMDLLDIAVVSEICPNPILEWSTKELAEKIAMRAEINWSSEHLRKRALISLREDKTRAANGLYNGPPRKKWRGKRSQDLPTLLREKWGPNWERKYSINDQYLRSLDRIKG